MAGAPGDWLKFNTRDFTLDSRNEFRNKYKELLRKEINPTRRLVHRLLTLSVVGRHSAKEKVTLDDLFLLHSMDGGDMVDVPWVVAKFLSDKAKGSKKKSLIVGAHLIGRIARSYSLMTPTYMRVVTLDKETSLLNVTKLVDLGICRYNGLRLGELLDDQLDNNEDKAIAAEAGEAHDDEGGVRRRPNMTFTNRLRAMDDRLWDIDTNIYKLSNDVEDLTYVVSRMSEQYDQFYGEFRHMRIEQERFHNWNTDHLSKLLAYHHIDHTRYNGTRHSYVPNIPDLGVQQGVNFMSSPQVFSTAPTASPNPFGYFDASGAGTSTSQNPGNDIDEE
ncbi:hypothetical protein Tco_0880977 [Tanacetum coccineum]